MKRFLLLMAGAMICVSLAAQEEGQSVKNDTVTIEDISKELALIKESILNPQKTKDTYMVPWKGKQKDLGKRGIYVYPVLDISTGVLTQKKPNMESPEIEESSSSSSSSTSVGFEFGGSIIFVPGRVVGDSLRINKLGFAFSTGFLTSVSNSDRYGAIYNILGKAGVEIGNQHLFGFGGDFLAGCGRLPGDLGFYEEGSNVIGEFTPYNKWSFVYGGQVWFRAGLVRIHKGMDIITYVRLMRATDSGGNICSSPQPHVERLHKEGWSVGILLRFKI